MSPYACTYPGCTVDPASGGGPVFRTSPKGGPFEGLCAEHMRAELDELVEDAEACANGQPT